MARAARLLGTGMGELAPHEPGGYPQALRRSVVWGSEPGSADSGCTAGQELGPIPKLLTPQLRTRLHHHGAGEGDLRLQERTESSAWAVPGMSQTLGHPPPAPWGVILCQEAELPNPSSASK